MILLASASMGWIMLTASETAEQALITATSMARGGSLPMFTEDQSSCWRISIARSSGSCVNEVSYEPPNRDIRAIQGAHVGGRAWGARDRSERAQDMVRANPGRGCRGVRFS